MDSNLLPPYAETLCDQIAQDIAHATTKRVLLCAVSAGETSKCREVKAKIKDEVFFSSRCRHDTSIEGEPDRLCNVHVLYMRDMSFVQILTSLLACVDSRIGGKTSIDVESHDKNLLEASYVPERVLFDLSLLKTLPNWQDHQGRRDL